MRRNIGTVLSLMRYTVGMRGLRPHLILGDRWQALRIPTMSLWEEHDVFATPTRRDARKTIAAQNRSIRIVPVPGAGNHLWIDQPDRVVEEIERFLSSSR